MASIKQIAKGRSDLYRVSINDLAVKEGWNSRILDDPENIEHIDMLAKSIAEEGVKQPLTVYMEDGKLYIAGIRPGAFEDAEVVDSDKASRGVTFDVTIDVTEWLGNEQYAFVPFEASAEISKQLAELASELDSEQPRHQICVELDPLSRVRSGDKATLWLDAERIHLFDPHSGDNLTRATESTGRHAATTG